MKSHLIPPAPWRETCTWGRGIEAPHVRLTPLERDERPIIAVDFAVRKARGDDGRADDDLETFSGNCRLEHWLHASDSIRDKRSRRLPCKLSGRLRETLVCREVQTAL